MRLDDGTRTHAVDIRFDGFEAFFGYVQTPDQAPAVAHPLDRVEAHRSSRRPRLPDHGAASSSAPASRVRANPPRHPLHGIGLDVTPTAFGPVLLRDDQSGRVSYFPRAMVRCRTDDGRTGAGWIEWNQPDPTPPD